MKQQNSRNIRVIILWIVAAAIFVGGYSALKKSERFGKNNSYYAYFTDVQGLQPSSPVNIRGVRVGKIHEIIIEPTGKVKVALTISKKVVLHEGTVAKLASGGITGEKIIDLELGTGAPVLENEATLSTKLDTNLLPVSVRFTPVFESAKYLLRSTDSVLQGFNFMVNTGLISKTAVKVIDIEQQTRGLATISHSLNNNTGKIASAIDSGASKTSALATKQPQLNNSINNAVNKTAAFAQKNTGANVASFQTSIKSLGQSLHKLDTSLAGLGGALNHKKSYNSSSASLDTLSQSWKELQKSPPGISIFGGKKKK